MTSKWVWLISRVARRMWFRATLSSILAVATALIAIVAAPYILPGLSTQIGPIQSTTSLASSHQAC